MKTWNLFGNGNLEAPVSLELLEGPAYLLAANRAFWWSVQLCDFFNKLGQPKWISNLKGCWDAGSDTEYTIDEYYGNLWEFWTYKYLQTPLLKLQTWASNHPKLKAYTSSLTIEQAEQLFGKDHADMGWLRDQAEENIQFENEMMAVKEYICPVCFYEMDDSPRDYNICARCGTEFGNDDELKTHAELRAEWIANGKNFWFKQNSQSG